MPLIGLVCLSGGESGRDGGDEIVDTASYCTNLIPVDTNVLQIKILETRMKGLERKHRAPQMIL